MCNFLFVFRQILWGAVAMGLVVACKPVTLVHNPTSPRVELPAEDDLLLLHDAAQEMALDGFQFGRSGHGWPADVGAVSCDEYVGRLVALGYLKAGLPFHGQLEIANLSDGDPGETVFLRLKSPDAQKIRIVRKDGKSETFSCVADADRFAIPPAAEPKWLP